jgi:hypothetical protein
MKPLSVPVSFRIESWIQGYVPELEKGNVNLYMYLIAVFAITRYFYNLNRIKFPLLLPISILEKNGDFRPQVSIYPSIGCIVVLDDKPIQLIQKPDQHFDGFWIAHFDEPISRINEIVEVKILGFTPDFESPVELSELQGYEDFLNFVEKNDIPKNF